MLYMIRMLVEPEKAWARDIAVIDKKITQNKNLSDKAFRLYALLFGYPPGTEFDDEYLAKILGISRRALDARKKELRDAGLLITEQIAPKFHTLYLGVDGMTAEQSMAKMKAEDCVLPDDTGAHYYIHFPPLSTPEE